MPPDDPIPVVNPDRYYELAERAGSPLTSQRRRPGAPTRKAATVTTPAKDLSIADLRRGLDALTNAPGLTGAQESRLAELDGEYRRRTAPDRKENRRALDGSRIEVRDQALKVLEREGRHLRTSQLDHVDHMLRAPRTESFDGQIIAKRLLITETEAYRSAFVKGVTQGSPNFSLEESRALDEFRAANEGTGSAGGFGVPVLIDPTIILTAGAAAAPLLDISRLVTITTDQWKGVSSAGVTWSYDAEASAVSDDAATFAQPTIPVYSARGFIPYSIEVGQDYPGFADEMSMILNQGFLNLVASQTVVGSGSSSPTGIFTTLANVTDPAHIVVSTLGSFGAVDAKSAWASLGERFRPNATWVMSPSVESQVRGWGNGLALSDFTVNLLADGTSVLTGKPVVVTDYAPAFTGTTSASTHLAVVGDFSNFLIVQRAGMTVELVNHLFDTSTGRPTGERGWYAYARHGFDTVAANAFRLIGQSTLV